MSSKECQFRNLLGKRVLIVGEVGTGKTTTTARFVSEAMKAGLEKHVTVIDLAPKRIKIGKKEISGRIKDRIKTSNQIKYLYSDKIRAPRIEGRSKEEVISFANDNLRTIERLFVEYRNAPTSILFVNDVTLYLHTGDIDQLIDLFSEADTVVANAYEGEILRFDHDAGISVRERTQLNQLKDWADIVIRTK